MVMAMTLLLTLSPSLCCMEADLTVSYSGLLLVANNGHQIVYLSASVSPFSMAANTPPRPSGSASPDSA